MLHPVIPVESVLFPTDEQTSTAALPACALHGPNLRLPVLTFSVTSPHGVTPGPSVAL